MTVEQMDKAIMDYIGEYWGMLYAEILWHRRKMIADYKEPEKIIALYREYRFLFE